ncbi:hypothetical protein PFISCL1PPCAC_25487, partial [Pristionchus fissidentatus]
PSSILFSTKSSEQSSMKKRSLHPRKVASNVVVWGDAAYCFCDEGLLWCLALPTLDWRKVWISNGSEILATGWYDVLLRLVDGQSGTFEVLRFNPNQR